MYISPCDHTCCSRAHPHIFTPTSVHKCKCTQMHIQTHRKHSHSGVLTPLRYTSREAQQQAPMHTYPHAWLLLLLVEVSACRGKQCELDCPGQALIHRHGPCVRHMFLFEDCPLSEVTHFCSHTSCCLEIFVFPQRWRCFFPSGESSFIKTLQAEEGCQRQGNVTTHRK